MGINRGWKPRWEIFDQYVFFCARVQVGGDEQSGSSRSQSISSGPGGGAGEEDAGGGEGGVQGEPDGGHREGANQDRRSAAPGAALCKKNVTELGVRVTGSLSEHGALYFLLISFSLLPSPVVGNEGKMGGKQICVHDSPFCFTVVSLFSSHQSHGEFI